MSAQALRDDAENERPSTRDLLLELATQAFVNEGYSNISVRELAKRSGLTSGAIYGNFDNKGDLLMAVIDSHISRQLEVVPRPESEHLPDVLADIFAAYPDRAAMRALLLEGAAAGRSDPDVQRRLQEGQSSSLSSWGVAYLEMQEHGELSEDLDPAEVVKMLWAMELGIGLLEAIGLSLPAPEQAGEIVRRMVAGLGEGPEHP